MTFDEFLALLDRALETFADASLSEGNVATSAQTSIGSQLKVIYDPTRTRADQPNLILIGVGCWIDHGQPVEHCGVCLSNKGTADCFGPTSQYASVTDFVLNPPANLSGLWDATIAGSKDPGELLRQYTLVVEEVGPDACFALVCWLALRCGVDADEIRLGKGRKWVAAVRHWETLGMADDAMSSWAALLSTLGHSHIGTQTDKPPQNEKTAASQLDLSRAWRETLEFTVNLLRQDVDPTAVPAHWELSAYTRARAFMASELRDYQDSLSRALRLQLLVPLADADDSRQLLVDAYFAVEPRSSGAKKLFIRSDRENTYLKQGYAMMGLYRPDERLVGTGSDITVSVNPLTGIYLKALWQELERLENERWRGNRPGDNPRGIESYRRNGGWNQPWWDDHGRYTLLGAPKRLADGRLGSRLDWSDVIEAAWRCYNPLRGLMVADALDHDRVCTPEQCRRLRLEQGQEATVKYLTAVRWVSDSAKSQSLFISPTVKRVFAAIASRDRSEAPIRVVDLPEEESFDYLELVGGFAVIHEQGVFLFDDWRSEQLNLEDLKEEVERTFRLHGEIQAVDDAELDGIVREKLPAHDSTKQQSVLGFLADLARLSTLRSRLAKAKHQCRPKSEKADVRRFRQRLEGRWGLEKVVDELYKRIAEIEDSYRTASTVRTQGLVAILATYGLPFFISGAITGFLADWIDAGAKVVDLGGLLPLFKVIVYLSIAGTLIKVVRMRQRSLARVGA